MNAWLSMCIHVHPSLWSWTPEGPSGLPEAPENMVGVIHLSSGRKGGGGWEEKKQINYLVSRERGADVRVGAEWGGWVGRIPLTENEHMSQLCKFL